MPRAAQPTQHFAINATTNSSVPTTIPGGVPCSNNPDRRFLYIRNYATSTNSIFVLFSDTDAATAGTHGELEIVPGAEYVFGGQLMPATRTLPGSFVMPNCPQEAVNVITLTSTASGCVITQ